MNRAFLRFCILLLCVGLFPACGRTQSADTKNKQPIALVNGQAVYEDELLPRMGSDLQRLRNQEYQLKQRALQSYILEKLWQAEAEKRKLTPDQYLEQEVDAKITEPTDAEIQTQYDAQKDQWKRPLSEVKEQVRQALRQGRIRQARRDFFQRLWDTASVTVLLEPPKMQVAHDAARVRGNPQAPVLIVEFSDFQCPYCRRVQPTLLALLKKYEGQVAVAYRDYPLRDMHPQAQLAAEASRCAGEQGKFWEYHDLLFGQTPSFQRDALNTHAQSLGLDVQRFSTCVETAKYRSGVEEDLQAGMKAGVSGTPAFFINGVFLDGAQPQSEFEKLIDAELKRKK